LSFAGNDEDKGLKQTSAYGRYLPAGLYSLIGNKVLLGDSQEPKTMVLRKLV